MSDLTNGVAAPAPPAVLTRTVTPTVPVTVTYEVTDLGRYPRPPALCRKTIDLCVPNNPISTQGAGTWRSFRIYLRYQLNTPTPTAPATATSEPCIGYASLAAPHEGGVISG